MLKKYFALFIFLLFLVSCAASQKPFAEQEAILKKLSLEKFGVSFRLSYNIDQSFALSIKQEKTTNQNPNPVLQFFVFDVAKNVTVFEDNVAGGKVRWKNPDQIEVILTPGTVSTEDNNKLYGYLYNVKLKTKADLNSSKKIKPNRTF